MHAVPFLSFCLDQANHQAPDRSSQDDADHFLAVPTTSLGVKALETGLHCLPLYQHCACSSEAWSEAAWVLLCQLPQQWTQHLEASGGAADELMVQHVGEA